MQPRRSSRSSATARAHRKTLGMLRRGGIAPTAAADTARGAAAEVGPAAAGDGGHVFGNFPNYYAFHPAKKRLAVLAPHLRATGVLRRALERHAALALRRPAGALLGGRRADERGGQAASRVAAHKRIRARLRSPMGARR